MPPATPDPTPTAATTEIDYAKAADIIPSAPLGAIIRFTDLTPEPPRRFNNKHAAWRSRNGSGRLIRFEPPLDGLQGHFVLHTGDYGSKSTIIVTVRTHFMLNSDLKFSIAQLPAHGSVAVLTKYRHVAELHHIAPSKQEAESWLHSNPYTDAYLEPIALTAPHPSAPRIASLAEFKKALCRGSRWEFRYAAKLGAGEPLTISNWQEREVVHTQSNRVAFAKSFDPSLIDIASTNPHKHASWLDLPKASQLSFPEDGHVRITRTDDPDCWIEYRALQAP